MCKAQERLHHGDARVDSGRANCSAILLAPHDLEGSLRVLHGGMPQISSSSCKGGQEALTHAAVDRIVCGEHPAAAARTGAGQNAPLVRRSGLVLLGLSNARRGTELLASASVAKLASS